MPSLDIAGGSLNKLLLVYQQLLPEFGGYLTDKARLHPDRLERLLAELAHDEPRYFAGRAKATQDRAEKPFGDAAKYADAYYGLKLGYAPKATAEGTEQRQWLAREYVRGLLWCLEYYHHGVGAWDWYYPALYAPLAQPTSSACARCSTAGPRAPRRPGACAPRGRDDGRRGRVRREPRVGARRRRHRAAVRAAHAAARRAAPQSSKLLPPPYAAS